MSCVPVVTLDGPSGSGKGTIACKVADTLGWYLLDSGVLYRVLAYQAVQNQVNLQDDDALSALAIKMDVRFEIGRNVVPVPVYLEGDVVTTAIRTEAVGKVASQVAALFRVREALLERQRSFRIAPGLVADGRDMGTVVFPDAQVKIYLTASVLARAQRRVEQLKAQGIDDTLERVRRQVEQRDHQDENRSVAPLKPAVDAIIIDSTDLSIDETLSRVMEVIRLHL